MLILRRQYSKLPWLGLLLVGLLLLGYGLSRSSSYQTCETNHHAYSAYQEDQDGPFALKWVWRNAKVKIRCTLDFVERNHAELTAVGTIALAIFTTSLWLATRSLVRHAPQIERAYISAGGDPAVYGRVYYETIFGDRFSSGFLYRIPARPGDSESIVPPNPRYTDDRKE